MKCKKCGAILLSTDTFCSECGAKVVIDACPNCGEKLRPGVKFCSKCGFKLENNSPGATPEDDEIPVTGQLATTDIPFDLIEKNILLEADKAKIETEDENKKITKKNTVNEDYDSGDRKNTAVTESEGYVIEKYSEKKDYSPVKEKYEEEEYTEEDGYDEYEEDVYEEDEYPDEEYSDEEYEEEPEEKSLLSRLLTAGMIVIGIVILLIVAMMFLNNRNEKKASEDKQTEIEESSEDTEETQEVDDGTIGTITVAEDVNIRDYPSTENSTVIKVARAGENYSYYGYSDDSQNWVHIKLDDGTEGYVSSKYVNID